MPAPAWVVDPRAHPRREIDLVAGRECHLCERTQAAARHADPVEAERLRSLRA
jgi:hypothetical protein